MRAASEGCHTSCMQGIFLLVVLVALALMSNVPHDVSYATLPCMWQTALDHFRSQPPPRGGAAQPWTRDEDACILHNEYGPDKRVPWAKLPLERSEEAARTRYRKYLHAGVVKKMHDTSSWSKQPGKYETVDDSAAAAAKTSTTCLRGSTMGSCSVTLARTSLRYVARCGRSARTMTFSNGT